MVYLRKLSPVDEGSRPGSINIITMSLKRFVFKVLYWIRNLRSKQLFLALKKYCHGDVLDIGGRDFYLTAKEKKINFESWTSLDIEENEMGIEDEKYTFISGDGCAMEFEDDKFDTILNIQVLEHVMEPNMMIMESHRVLKTNGIGVFLIPQTSTVHLVPHHYYNFTRFWIKEIMEKAGFEILSLNPLGGIWSTMGSHMFYFNLQSIRFKGMSTKECKRNVFFYLFYPLMVLYTIINIPIVMLLSLGDLTEEPNNHLVVVRKK